MADQHLPPGDAACSQNGKTSVGKIERRNLLLGMGGLYGATTLTTNPLAFANPVSPDFSKCTTTVDPDINCCPPRPGTEIIDFVASAKQAYERKPAHDASETYIQQYSKAITKMKSLNLTDPRNFYQQANVHCVYCDEGYPQSGYPSQKLDVHRSWFFFPWHRMYLYFFERICKNLLDDDTFTLPFWQWDDASGMEMPGLMYNDTKLSLYDCLRDPNHLPPTVIDLAFSRKDRMKPPIPPNIQIKYNLSTMYTQMITQSPTPQKFFGQPLRAGDKPDPGEGSIESLPHNCVHDWTGDPAQPNVEDMGVLYAAGRDPIFYAHHGNIDRMWYIYNNVLKGKNITDGDWLNSSFIFYNEEAKPVRVKIQDSLDITKLGYTYPDLTLEWKKYKPKPRRKGIALPPSPKIGVVFPTPLSKTISVLVDRPMKSRSKKEKDEAEETLEIQGINFNKREYVKFDVYVNEDDPSLSGPDKTEFLGSFINLVHGHGMNATTNKEFALNKVLEELGADDSGKISVTLVPQSGDVTITGIQITYDRSKF
ncbi:hypothetical protein ACH5RR_028254 [Cinchona calisaya]|uniref:Tyrosinase copper-binding domain-containing protein n=1 Tax=Cinchona calisaya TaxID=153742 RepID=A0ABD2YPG3_9GENT